MARWVGSLGVTYAWDAWTVGLTWSHGEYETSSSSDNDNLDTIQFTGAYALGPGISLEGMVGYSDYDDDDGAQNADYDTVEIGTGIHIGF